MKLKGEPTTIPITPTPGFLAIKIHNEKASRWRMYESKKIEEARYCIEKMTDFKEINLIKELKGNEDQTHHKKSYMKPLNHEQIRKCRYANNCRNPNCIFQHQGDKGYKEEKSLDNKGQNYEKRRVSFSNKPQKLNKQNNSNSNYKEEQKPEHRRPRERTH